MVALRAPWNQKDEQNCRRLTQTFCDEASFYSCAAVVAGRKSCRIAVMLELYCIVCSAVEKDLRKQLWNRNLVVVFIINFSLWNFFFQQCSVDYYFFLLSFDLMVSLRTSYVKWLKIELSIVNKVHQSNAEECHWY